MRLTQEKGQAGKEDSVSKGKMGAKSPLTDRVDDEENGRGPSKTGRSAVVAVTIAAAVGILSLKSGCTFTSVGLDSVEDASPDADTGPDTGPDADRDGPDAEVGIDADLDSRPDTGLDADVERDSGHDADMGHDADVEADAGHDSGLDADVEEDAGHDAGPDADTDASIDADVDAGETGVDAGSDADAAETGVDAGGDSDAAVACGAASTGTLAAQWLNISTPYTVGGYVFTYTGKDATHAIFSITCGGTAVAGSPLTCLIGSETPLEIPADGKRIRINPTSANAAAAYASIIVENL